MRYERIVGVALAALLALGCSCGGGVCKLGDAKACPSDQLCEAVRGKTDGLCTPPVQIQGRVLDLATSTGIGNATVTALDENGAPAGLVAVSEGDGKYALSIPSERLDDKGTPAGRKVTLRAAAANYQPFPSGIRIALPVDTTGAAQASAGKPWVVSGPLTDVGLEALSVVEKGRPSISGTVEVIAGQRGILVVAEASGVGASAIADTLGRFTVFNVVPGVYQVQAYARGSNYTAAPVTVGTGKDATGVEIKKSTASTATLSGSAQIVAGTGQTSVVMVVESTFNDKLARGEVPPGLRAPDPGIAPNVSGAFSIAGVPDGKYVVLAAFENDGLVRDPDPNIAGTQVQHLTVNGGVASATPAFKVTTAIVALSPGGGDAIDEVGGTPEFVWQPYASAKTYGLIVLDGSGFTVWDAGTVLAVSGSNVKVTYAGPPLKTGGIYQWRATAKGTPGNPLSQTEDLKGLFRVK